MSVNCTHHFVLDGPAPEAIGICKYCGKTREFTGGDRSFAEASVSWRERRVFAMQRKEPTAVQGRRVGRRQAVRS